MCEIRAGRFALPPSSASFVIEATKQRGKCNKIISIRSKIPKVVKNDIMNHFRKAFVLHTAYD